MSDLPRLSNHLLSDRVTRPQRILQFGGGNFLRGFADRMIGALNRAGLFDGEIVVVQSTAGSRASALNAQDGLFTVIERGLADGKPVDRTELVTSIRRAVDANTQWSEILEIARSPDLQIVLSNTTEAGIAIDPADSIDAPKSFPARLAAVLHARFVAGQTGLIIIPCELIEKNGQTLRSLVVELASRWQLNDAFTHWIDRECVFADTLVDQIIPGFPADVAEATFHRLGYRDDLLVAVEPFHFWAIQAPPVVRELLPFDKVGLNIAWTDDLGPYRDRKVRILNGGHTGMALAAFLAGKNTVGECMNDPLIRQFLERLLREDVKPTLPLPAGEVDAFIDRTNERFANPFARHQLLSIALNSVAKFKARLLPTLRDRIGQLGAAPDTIAFSLAALIAFYRSTTHEPGKLIGDRSGEKYVIADSQSVLDAFRFHWTRYAADADLAGLASRVLGDSTIWTESIVSMPGLHSRVTIHLSAILHDGAVAAFRLIERDQAALRGTSTASIIA